MLPDMARHSEKLYYFYEIANEGSLQATARKIGISAPSLSIALKQLEAVTGTVLFSRSKSGVTLTDAGEKLLVFCRRYYREMEEVQRLMTQPLHPTTRKIKVGTFQSIALYFWPLLIDILKDDPQFRLSIQTNRSKQILESLLKRDIDIALTVEAFKHEKLIKHELYKDEYAFYCSSKWKKAELKKGDVKKSAILYIPDAIDETGKSLRSYLHSWDLTFGDEFELDSLEVIGEFIKKDYGVGILPRKVAKTYGKDIKPLKVEGVPDTKFGTHRFFLSYRDDLDIPNNIMKQMLHAARQAVIELNS